MIALDTSPIGKLHLETKFLSLKAYFTQCVLKILLLKFVLKS